MNVRAQWFGQKWHVVDSSFTVVKPRSIGIRLATHAVPTAVNTGVNSGPGFCRLNGSHEPFDDATIEKLYPTRDSYLSKVKSATEANLKAGYILAPEAHATIADAEKSAVGR
jgi:alpha/beta hydrolase family protein